MSKKIAIIGGGIIGCLSAIKLRESGFSVVIVDKNEIGKESSWAGAGILFPLWPALAKRIPVFEELKLTGGWAGYYDCNKLDNNAVVGKHPKYENLYMASGFTGRGLMQAPGIGRALTELITTGSYQSIDLNCFAIDRVLKKTKRLEPYVL